MPNGKVPEREKIKSFSKELYMVPGKKGKHKNSLQAIADNVLREFHISFSKRTIGNWAKEINENGVSWESEYLASASIGITEARINKSNNIGRDPEEIFQEEVIRDARTRYLTCDKTHKYQVKIIEIIYASILGTISTLANTYDGNAAKIPIDELVEAISPSLLKTIVESEKELDRRLEEMKDISVNSGRNDSDITASPLVIREVRLVKEDGSEVKKV